MKDNLNHNGQKETIQMDILPKWQTARDFCQIGIQIFLKNPLDDTDLQGILKETMDGDSHNDIKRGYLKCWSSMAEADIVFPNPTDLARVAVVSEKSGFFQLTTLKITYNIFITGEK